MTLLSLTTVFRKEIQRMFILISFNRKLKVVSQQNYRDLMTPVPWVLQHLLWNTRYGEWRPPRSLTPTPRRSSWTATPACPSSPPCSSTQTATMKNIISTNGLIMWQTMAMYQLYRCNIYVASRKSGLHNVNRVWMIGYHKYSRGSIHLLLKWATPSGHHLSWCQVCASAWSS